MRETPLDAGTGLRRGYACPAPGSDFWPAALFFFEEKRKVAQIRT